MPCHAMQRPAVGAGTQKRNRKRNRNRIAALCVALHRNVVSRLRCVVLCCGVSTHGNVGYVQSRWVCARGPETFVCSSSSSKYNSSGASSFLVRACCWYIAMFSVGRGLVFGPCCLSREMNDCGPFVCWFVSIEDRTTARTGRVVLRYGIGIRIRIRSNAFLHRGRDWTGLDGTGPPLL